MVNSKFHQASDAQDHAGFYIPAEECMTCGCCIGEAPTVFAWREEKNGACYVQKQPETKSEKEAAVTGMEICHVDCIYYGGNDPEILEMIGLRKISYDVVHQLNVPRRNWFWTKFLRLFSRNKHPTNR